VTFVSRTLLFFVLCVVKCVLNIFTSYSSVFEIRVGICQQMLLKYGATRNLTVVSDNLNWVLFL